MIYKSFLLTVTMCCLVLGIVRAAKAEESKAQYGLLLDVDTGQVIWSKNAKEPMAPASMSKLMTLYVVFDHLKNGHLQLTDKVFVSQNAWIKGGAVSGSSTMFAKPSSTITVDDAIQAIVVTSANDACISLAEMLGGSEEGFAKMMNQKAADLKLTSTSFANATGWPDPNQKMSAYDLAVLARRLAIDFPEYFHYFKQKRFTWNHITQTNRNTLLLKDESVDGLKTGHTATSQYGIAVSATRGNQRRILILNGIKSQHERFQEAKRLMDWAFTGFTRKTLVQEGQIMETLKVKDGAKDTVKLVTPGAVTRLLPYAENPNVAVVIEQTEPRAPIQKGQVLGHLVIKTNQSDEPESIDLIALENVPQQGYFRQFWKKIKAITYDRFFG